jgi:hypothetical protein
MHSRVALADEPTQEDEVLADGCARVVLQRFATRAGVGVPRADAGLGKQSPRADVRRPGSGRHARRIGTEAKRCSQ